MITIKSLEIIIVNLHYHQYIIEACIDLTFKTT